MNSCNKVQQMVAIYQDLRKVMIQLLDKLSTLNCAAVPLLAQLHTYLPLTFSSCAIAYKRSFCS